MNNPSLHALLLLSDSALPLGSFAFSSGLESYLAHHKASSSNGTRSSVVHDFDVFLSMSLRNLASTSLPYVLDAYHHPDHLIQLDNDMDASTPCTVARRASVAQGKALVGLWERAFAAAVTSSDTNREALAQISKFISLQKASRPDSVFGLQINAHFAPLFGSVCYALGLSSEDTSYLFLLNHAKALLSAAVRASVMGPYQSQAILASPNLQDKVKACVTSETLTKVEDAGLTIPPMDLWMGRHELLYSRIFNS